MPDPIASTSNAGGSLRTLSGPLNSPAMRAAGFSATLYLGWMFIAGMFHPSLNWLTGGVGATGAILFYYSCLDGFALALSAAFLFVVDGRRFRSLGLWFFPGWWRHAALGVATGAITISVVATVVVNWRAPAPSFQLQGISRLLALIAFFLLAAAFEELMFRGYAWQRLADSLGSVAATLISSLLFGLAHAANPRATFLSVSNTVLAGALMSVARARSRALWMPIGLHFGWNFFLGGVFQYPVSGYQMSSGTVFASSIAPDWLTGGGYGLEASVLLTAAAGLATLLLFLCPRNLLSPSDIRE